MKRQTAIGLILVLFLGLTLGVSQVHAEKGYGKALKTTVSMKDTKAMLQKMLNEIEKTMKPLNELTIATGDLRKKYEMFSGELRDIRALADDVRKNATNMWAHGDSYFAAWDTEIQKLESETVRQISQERKNEVTQKYEEIRTTMKDAKSVFAPFTENLRDIDTYLATDLTTKGVEAMASLVKQANDDAKVVKEKINAVIIAIDKVSPMISSK
jgi:predicted  nucleic acid-binding Zn-ribbon protein